MCLLMFVSVSYILLAYFLKVLPAITLLQVIWLSPFFPETDYTNLLPVNLPVETLCFIKALKVCSHLLFVFVGSINVPKTNCLEVNQSGKSKQLKTADLRASTHKKKIRYSNSNS